MSDLLLLDNVSKCFFTNSSKTDVLKNINFSIKNNEIVALIGPSGCGKSTLLNLVSGLEQPTSGNIVLSGNVGYMFQKDTLLPWRNVLSNVLFGLEIKKKKTKENIDYANILLKKYGLDKFKTSYPNELSGGMRQRVSLIRTLCLKPDLLLLDEPFSSLDAQTKLLVQDDVYQIIKKEQLACLLVTHDISEAIALANRIIVLSPRPCQIKEIINIPFSNMNPKERRNNESFPKLFNHIFSLIS